MSKQTKADMVLMAVVLCWGASNYAITLCLRAMGPNTLNAWRFLIGFAVVALLGVKQLKKMNRTTFLYGLAIGFFLAGNYYFNNQGLLHTTISNAGFFCCLPVLFVPFGEWVFFKRKPERKLAIAVVLAIIGVFMMSMKGDFTLNRDTMYGDFLCFLVTISYTFVLLITEKALKDERVSAFNIGVIQIGVVWLISTALSLGTENMEVSWNSAVILVVLALGIFCTGFSFVAEPVCQQYTPGSHVSLIFALEPVFCAIVAYLFADERLYTINYAGMVTLLAALLIMELDWGSIFGKKK